MVHARARGNGAFHSVERVHQPAQFGRAGAQNGFFPDAGRNRAVRAAYPAGHDRGPLACDAVSCWRPDKGVAVIARGEVDKKVLV